MHESIKNICVSYFPSKESSATTSMSIGEILSKIKDGKYQDVISQIRNYVKNGQIDEAKLLKGALPAVTFSGLYPEHRRDGYCTKYNNLIVIDIDKLTEDKIPEVRDQLVNDRHIVALWMSPSGNGYKGLIQLHYEGQDEDISIRDKHRAAFYTIYEYMLAMYGIELDKSGSDPTRLCFMSYDPELIIKDNAEAFVVGYDNMRILNSKRMNEPNKGIEKPHKIKLNREYNWNKLIGQTWNIEEYQENKQTLYAILRKMKRKNISITSTFEEWVKVAYAIANSMYPAVGKEVFIKMCELDGINHNPQASERLIYDAYCNNSGNVHFETIIYLAKQKGVIA